MAQGKEFTQEERDNILETIKPYLQMGDSINQACLSAGFDPWTVYKWCEKDETLSNKIKGWQNMVNNIAKQNLIKSIRGEAKIDPVTGKPFPEDPWVISPDLDNAKWWLERKEKKTFGRNVDVTTDGEPISGVDKVEWVIVEGEDEETIEDEGDAK